MRRKRREHQGVYHRNPRILLETRLGIQIPEPNPKQVSGTKSVHSDEHITWSCGWHGPLEDYTVLPLPTRGFPLPCESECNSTSSAPEKDVTSVCYSGHKFGMTRIRAPVHSNSSVCFPVESRFRMVQGEPPNPKPRIQTSVLQIAPDLNKKSRTPNCKPSVGARKTLAT